MPGVKFTRRSYYNAAIEHLGMAGRLLREKEYFAAHYFAGIAVEAILRAHGVNEEESFSSNHSIEYWALKAELAPVSSAETNDVNDRFREALDEINMRWRANQRYMSAKMLDTYLHSTRLDKIRGDRVKYSSNRLFEMADIVVARGVEKWNPKN